MVKKTKLCLVGAGSIGRRHLRILLERDDTELMVVDPSEACREKVRELAPHVPFFASMKEAVKVGGAEAVILATPHTMHASMALEAIALGVHVFCEKPMSDSMEECVAMLQAARKSDKVFSVGFMFRFDPFIRKVKELIEEGCIGTMVHYASRFATYNTLLCSVTRHQEKTPFALVMDCIHDSDLLYHITGKMPDTVLARAYKAGEMPLSSPQNVVDTLYGWEKEAMGAHIHFNYVQHPQVHTLEVVGDLGYIQGDFMSATVTLGTRDGKVEVFRDLRGEFDNVYRAEWNEFLRAVRGERKAENPPEEAIFSTLLMHGQIESAQSGKSVDLHSLAERYGFSF